MFKHTSVLATAIGIAVLGGCAGDERPGNDGHRGHRHGHGARSHKASGHAGHVADLDQDFLPARVRSAFTREFQGATIQDVEKRTRSDGEVRWEVRFTGEDGGLRTAEFDPHGKLVAGG